MPDDRLIDELTGISFRSAATYKIQEEIGRGGMGIVFLADRECEGVTDRVVLKTLQSLSSEQTGRLKREANLATALRHENIVKTYGLESIPVSELPGALGGALQTFTGVSPRRRLPGRAGGRIGGRLPRRPAPPPPAPVSRERVMLMVMDYVDGTDLYSLLKRHLKQGLILPVPIAAFILSRVARALEYAHAWIVHRDISPENVLVNRQGVVKLTDFGIAVDGKEGVAQLAGKFPYMPSEQLAGERVDARADLFALGVTAYELLSGLHPFPVEPDDSDTVWLKECFEARRTVPPPLAAIRDDIPELLSDVVARMLAFDKSDRPASARELVHTLEQKFLYASGFGPTNNSLMVYLDLFDRKFSDPGDADLKQLAFLKTDGGAIRAHRSFRPDLYSKEGLALAQRDPHGLGSRLLRRMSRGAS